MNLLGKVFVVLILVMSILFMGLAVAVYSAHKNWKETVERPQDQVVPGKPLGLKFQLQQAQARNQELQLRFDNLQKTIAQEEAFQRANLAQLRTELEQLEKEYNLVVNQQATLRQGERQAVEAMKEAQAMLDAKLAEIDTLRNEISKAYEDRQSFFKQVVAKTDELHQTMGDLERLKANHAVLAEQLAKAEVVLDRNGLDLNQPVDDLPPKVDGIVLASSSEGLVEISVGADEGLRRGHQLVVYRVNGGDSKFLGKIEVVQAFADRAVAKVMPEYRKGPIQREDRVATRLN